MTDSRPHPHPRFPISAFNPDPPIAIDYGDFSLSTAIAHAILRNPTLRDIHYISYKLLKMNYALWRVVQAHNNLKSSNTESKRSSYDNPSLWC